MVEKKQRETLKAFRDGSCNLLISTSVGEEGLDFQAGFSPISMRIYSFILCLQECDLIVRYDPLQNMVGYLQSRGRARRHDSTYIVMIPEGSYEDRLRYATMRDSEPGLRSLYQRRHTTKQPQTEEAEEPDDPADLTARARYEIPSTGAVLTFGSAISLLNNLCALVPRDKYTAVLQPRYTGDFMSTVELPSALPIPRERLTYRGAIRRTKREAKAAAAFVACKVLHQLGVFDDYLLPARKTTGAIIQDADGRNIPEVGHVSEMMEVLVCDPWTAWHLPSEENTMSPDAWVHSILLGDAMEAQMGLITASPLGFPSQLSCELGHVQLSAPVQLRWPSGDELKLLDEYTTLGIRWCNTSRLIKTPLTCFLVPLDSDGQPDFEAMREAVRSPTRRNSAEITHEHEGHLLLQNKFGFGRPLLLRRLRDDLTPLSRPSPLDGPVTDGEFDTYVELLESIYGRGKRPVFIPWEGSMLLVRSSPKLFASSGL
jgi:endoribonuclease Dicer